VPGERVAGHLGRAGKELELFEKHELSDKGFKRESIMKFKTNLKKILFLTITLLFLFTLKSFNKIESEDTDGDLHLTRASINGHIWHKVQQKAKDTVVQLFIYNSVFNWLEPHKSPKQKRAYASGFFIDQNGYIVSNFHAIDDAINVEIQIPSLGKQRFEVEVVGVNPDRDVSLLKLTEESLNKVKEKLGQISYLELGDSDKVVRTQEVLALGYPLGQEKLKATQGIVSGRESVWGESYIQITAPINPGNSGGPSLNNKGQVVGINTAGIEEAQNIGYIIPINDVKSVIQELHKTKFLRKPILGCEFNIANEDMVKFLGNPEQGGLYIARVHKDTLFERAGVQPGDMWYQINGHAIDLYGEVSVDWSEDKVSFLDFINRLNIEQNVKIVVYRNGKRKELSFKFEVLDQLPIRRFYPLHEKVDYEIIGGMVVMDLTLNHVSKLEDDNNYLVKYRKRENQYEPRIILTHIFPDSQTEEARVLDVGDVLEQVNGREVKTLSDFRTLVLGSKNTGFLNIKTKEKRFSVLSLEKIVKEEDALATNYFFKKSKLVEDLGES